jgi:hypothetical protein
MSGISPDNPISFWLDNLLNLVSDLAVGYSGFTDLDGFLDGFTGHFDKI